MQKLLNLSDITLSNALRVRHSVDQNVVEDYAEAMKAKAVFPPIDVFSVGNTGYLLVDGWHRYYASRLIEKTKIHAEVHDGDESEALKFALKSNCKHGLRRSNADKRRCVELAIKHWPDITNRALSEICGVSHTFINKVRSLIDPPDEPPKEQPKPEPKKEETTKKEPEESKPKEVVDKTGFPIPPKALEFWNRQDEVDHILFYVQAIHDELKSAQDAKDLLYNEIVFASAFSELSRLRDNLKCGIPHAVCTSCQGQLTDTCTLCGGKGLISKFRWDSVVPEEIKKMRMKGIK